MKLLLSQKNELFEIIEENDLSPNQFKLEEINSDNSVLVVYKANPEYKFKIADAKTLTYYVVFSPGANVFTQAEASDHWFNVTIWFSQWIESLIEETSQEDLWANMYKMITDVQIDTGFDNDKFTVRQYQILSDRIKQLQTGVSALALPSEQIDTINKKLDYLLEQGKTLSKSDWQSLFIGGIWSLIVAMAIPPEANHLIWELVKQFFNGIILLP